MTTTPDNPKEPRSEIVKIRLTPTEKRLLETRAKERNTTFARLIRDAVLNNPETSEPRTTPRRQIIVHTADPALVREISRIGNNLNQIARRLNTLNKQGALTTSAVIAGITTLKAIADELHKLMNPDAQ